MSNITMYDENLLAAIDKAKEIAIDEIWCIKNHWNTSEYKHAFDHDRMMHNLRHAMDVIKDVTTTKAKILEYQPHAVAAMCGNISPVVHNVPTATPGVTVK